jgi:hypothetical protein
MIKDIERANCICTDKANGLTLAFIGNKWNLSRERIRRIIMENNDRFAANSETVSIIQETTVVEAIEKWLRCGLISTRVALRLKYFTEYYPEINVWQLAQYPANEFLTIQNFGKKSLKELRTAISTVIP